MRRAIGLLATFLVPAACGRIDDQAAQTTTQAVTATTTGQVFKVGVLINSAAAGKNDFLAAVNLAVTQVNKALKDIGAGQYSFKAVITPYTNTPYSPDNTQLPAIDLVNNQGVLGIIVDDSQATIDVNELNYEFSPRLAQNVTVTCFQCSFDRIHSGADTAGASDIDGWLFRTYFNAKFEGGLHSQLVRARVRHGDTNNDGFIRVVVYYAFGDHFTEGSTFSGFFDQITPEPHLVESIIRSGDFNADAARIFDTFPDAHPVDVVVIMMSASEAFQALTAIKNFSLAYAKPPIQLSEEVRRDAFLPALVATGLNLEGDSVLRVSNSPSGPLFKSAFSSATGHDPEMTASFAYDSTVLMAGAIGQAFHFQSLDPFTIKGGFFGINDVTGTIIRPRVSDFETAARLINKDMPINYEGGGSSTDFDFRGENYPDLVHWKIEKGKFADKEVYGCDPDHPSCFKR